MARQRGGEWLVRIEDLDPPREVPGAAERQLQTLAAFGLVSDRPVLRQSERGETYQAALHWLLDQGLAFECPCSRSELEAVGGIHRQCLHPRQDRATAVRLRVPDLSVSFVDAIQGPQRQSLADEVGDFVLRRADGFWAYQLAVVLDDAEQGISEVVRGADLLDSTPRQIFLQRQLALPTPRYAHLALVLDEHGRKLGKSLQALPVDASQPWPALAAAWAFLGQPPAALPRGAAPETSLRRALTDFDPARLPALAAAPVSTTAAAP
jgi:glutamyl-Q tRNA(Asp) synthetase